MVPVVMVLQLLAAPLASSIQPWQVQLPASYSQPSFLPSLALAWPPSWPPSSWQALLI